MLTTTLNNGVEMPMLGYGVFQTPPDETERCVREALEVGYRLIDTAQAYGNEEGVGAAIAACGVPRDEIFITSKIWVSNMNHERAAASIDESLAKLGTDHIDLMLLHQPMGDHPGAYRAMEDAYKAGKLRAIGVSNFYPERLVDVAALAEIPPAVNQVETHPFRQDDAAHAVMAELGVQHEAWAPFAEGRNNIFANPVLTGIGATYGKKPGQVVLRALMQKCRRTSSSSRSRRTASAWSRTSTSSTSSWTPTTWPPSGPSTTAPSRASSTTTIPGPSSRCWTASRSRSAARCTETAPTRVRRRIRVRRREGVMAGAAAPRRRGAADRSPVGAHPPENHHM